MKIPIKLAGFSLLELMLAMVFSLILVGQLITVYLGYKKTYAVIQTLEDIRANGQSAIYFLDRDIREAGFIGCKNLSANPELYTREKLPLAFKSENLIH